jgi:Listeria-Bacteroides repeat domain (List_Bact_rpt).
MKIKFYLLLIALVTSIGSVFGQTFTSAGVNYRVLDATTVEVIRTDYSGALTIPSTVNYGATDYAVKSIEANAFNLNDKLTSVVLSEGIATMGANAFQGCVNLIDVALPTSLTVIPVAAFRSNSKMQSVIISEGTTRIEREAFMNATALENINIPSSMTFIADAVFREVPNATISVTSSGNFPLENGVLYSAGKTEIVYYRPSKPDTSYEFPNTITTIDRYTFVLAANLQSFTVESGGANAFIERDGIIYNTNATNRQLVVCAPGTLLKDIVIPDDLDVKNLSNFAFWNCKNIESIFFPASVTSINNGDAFRSCVNLERFEVAVGSPFTVDSEGVMYSNSGSTLYMYPPGRNEVSYDIPASVTAIADNAFRHCYTLESMIVPEGVKTIGYGGFNSCYNLKSITFPSSLEKIGAYSFRSCHSLTEVNFANNMLFTEIPEEAFSDTPSLKTLVLPETITKIGISAFDQSGIEEITLPSNLETIGNLAFRNTPLESITIPASVTSIGDNAFLSSTSLQEITFLGATPPATIGNNAFSSIAEDAYVIVPKGSEDDYTQLVTDGKLPVSAENIYVEAEVKVIDVPTNPSKPTFVDDKGNVIPNLPGMVAEDKEYTILPEDPEKHEVEKVILHHPDGTETELERDPDSGEFKITLDDDMDIEVVIVAKKVVTFINDGVSTLQYVKNGELAVAPNVSKAGSTLSGWANGSAGLWNFSTPVTVDLTLTASWTADVMYTVTINPIAGVSVNKSTTSVKAGSTFSFTVTATGTVTAYMDGSVFAPASDNFYSLTVSDNVTFTFALTAGGGSGSGTTTDGKVLVDGSEPNIGGGFPSTGEIVLTPPAVTPGTTPSVTIDGKEVGGSWTTDEDGKPVYVIEYEGLPNGDHTLVVDGKEIEFTTDNGSGSGSGSGSTGGTKVIVDGSDPVIPGEFPSTGGIVIYPPAIDPSNPGTITIDGKEVNVTVITDANGNPIAVEISYDGLTDGTHTLVIDGEEFEFTTGSGSGATGGGKVIVDGSEPTIPGDFPPTGGIIIYPPAIDPSNPGTVTIDGKEVPVTVITDKNGNPIAVSIDYDGLVDGEHTLVINGKEYNFTTSKNAGATSNTVLSTSATVTASYGTVTIDTPKVSTVYVVSLSGSVVYNAKVVGTVTVNVQAGIYVVVVDGVSQKIVVR